MKDLSYMPANTESSEAQQPAKEARKPMPRWVVWTVPIVLWGLLVGGSYFLAQQYITGLQQQLVQIQTSAEALNKTVLDLHTQLGEHKESLAELQLQFSTVQNDLEIVKEELSLAGSTLNSSDQTRQALNERISELSRQLETLRGSIAKLEEAARAY
ncbi:hypothetical protein [Paenibacillus senegalensis]|uniref:hypothetical protein n=1 Tax=Paenibacillus senegalensis TaxID=1465766 RepID=UPI0002884D17|nr:hypothetical protein [Paenibacillus senegalensis]